MKIIGLTGNIGSGKTTVCKLFNEQFNIPIYNADQRAKSLMSKSPLKDLIRESFGSKAYTLTKLNSKWLANEVFNNPDKLELLNSLVHPAVKLDFENWCSEMQDANHKYVLKEAAILFETGSNKLVNKVILITAPKKVRIARTMSSDNASYDDVKKRIDLQWSQKKKKKLSDFIINNDGEQQLEKQIVEVHNQLVL